MAENKRTINTFERAAKIAKLIEIEDIFMLKGDFFRSEEFPDEAENIELKFDVGSKVRHYDKKLLQIGIRLALSFVLPDTQEKHFQAQGLYCLNYTISPKGRIYKKDLEAFAAINGVYHVWPYWREFVQNITQRLNLPPLTLAVLKIPKAAPRKGNEEIVKQTKKKRL